VEDLLQERGIDISHETVRFWWNRFGPLFAAEIHTKRVSQMRAYSNWQWHLEDVFVKINGEMHYLGGLWITKEKSWKASLQSAVIARQPKNSRGKP
jgi:transposase-like protein